MLTPDVGSTGQQNTGSKVLDHSMHEASLTAVDIADNDAGPSIRIELELNDDLAYFRGHFPGHPILPGVVQSGWAILYGARYLGLPVHVRRLEVLKFRKLIQPGRTLVLTLQLKPNGKLVFQYTCGDDVMSSGRIVYLESA